MPRKISDQTKNLIQELYHTGLSVVEISRKTNVPYSTVYGYTQILKKGFDSFTDYQEIKAKERGFNSLTEYRMYRVKQNGYLSLTDYQEIKSKERGFNSLTEYKEYLLRKRGFTSYRDYQRYLVQKKGVISSKDIESINKGQIKQGLSDLIKRRLELLGRNQTWLAKEIGVSRQSVSLYVKGKSIPNSTLLKKLCSSLNLSHKTLDDLLE